MSHLSMAWGVARGGPLALVQISPGRAGSVHTFGQKPYQRESIYKDMPGKPRALEAIIRKWAGRSASARLWLHADEDVAARVPSWPDT